MKSSVSRKKNTIGRHERSHITKHLVQGVYVCIYVPMWGSLSHTDAWEAFVHNHSPLCFIAGSHWTWSSLLWLTGHEGPEILLSLVPMLAPLVLYPLTQLPSLYKMINVDERMNSWKKSTSKLAQKEMEMLWPILKSWISDWKPSTERTQANCGGTLENKEAHSNLLSQRDCAGAYGRHEASVTLVQLCDHTDRKSLREIQKSQQSVTCQVQYLVRRITFCCQVGLL